MDRGPHSRVVTGLSDLPCVRSAQCEVSSSRGMAGGYYFQPEVISWGKCSLWPAASCKPSLEPRQLLGTLTTWAKRYGPASFASSCSGVWFW